MILDIPLLYETGEDRKVDYVVVVRQMRKSRESRAIAGPGMTGEKLASLLADRCQTRKNAVVRDFVKKHNSENCESR